MYDTEWEAILNTGWDVKLARKIFMEDPEVQKYGVDLQVWFDRLEDFRCPWLSKATKVV